MMVERFHMNFISSNKLGTLKYTRSIFLIVCNGQGFYCTLILIIIYIIICSCYIVVHLLSSFQIYSIVALCLILFNLDFHCSFIIII